MTKIPDTPSEYGLDGEGLYKRWMLELDLADKRERDWTKASRQIWNKYRGESRKRNSFNILYSNTETLSSAVYNAPPKPDVRRRFSDSDPISKVASRMLERALTFSIDSDSFQQAIKYDVLDMLLPGRGTSRVRYVPTFNSAEPSGESPESTEPPTPGIATPTQHGLVGSLGEAIPRKGGGEVALPSVGEDEATETLESEDSDELSWEQCVVEHVQWDDLRISSGKTWEQVCWVAMRHRMSRTELIDKFGAEVGKAMTLDDLNDESMRGENKDVAEAFKTAEVWEIWDKDTKTVLFISSGHKKGPLKKLDDPLKLTNFFPIPRPLYATCDSDSLIPLPLYEQYKEQAVELDRISVRINKIIDSLKVRGVYDSTMAEVSELLKGEDNDLIPAQNAAAWIERGGIEKAIWMMPIEAGANVLKILYEQRNASKQVIYEITGISDIIRGSTDPRETASAQQLKTKWGGQRISRLQSEVRRYANDLIRMMAEIISEKFQPETLMKMTNMKLPTDADVAQVMQQFQMQQMMQQQQQAQQGQPGQQPQPQAPQQSVAQPPPKPDATVEQVMQLLHDDALRTFRIDVEADSMVAEAMQAEAQEIEQLVQALVSMIAGLAPAVTSGALPIESAKAIMMAVTRRAKMGNAIEDALDKMKPPEPPPDPEAGKAQGAMQLAQLNAQSAQTIAAGKAQMDQQIKQAEAQAMMQVEQMKAQAVMQAEQQRAQAEVEREAQKTQFEIQKHDSQLDHAYRLAQLKAQFDSEQAGREDAFNRFKTEADNATKIAVANIAAETAAQSAQLSADTATATAQLSSDTTKETAKMGAENQAKAVKNSPESKSADSNAAIATALEGLTTAFAELKKPRSKTATLSNGKIIRIDES